MRHATSLVSLPFLLSLRRETAMNGRPRRAAVAVTPTVCAWCGRSASLRGLARWSGAGRRGQGGCVFMAMSPVKTRATKKGPPRKRSWNASGAGPFRYLPTSGRPLQIPDLTDLQVAGGDVAVASAIIITDGGLLYNTENRAARRFFSAGSRARGRPWPAPGSGSFIEAEACWDGIALRGSGRHGLEARGT